jgi:ParB family transcriptional regulator, chromosome partitioning protein
MTKQKKGREKASGTAIEQPNRTAAPETATAEQVTTHIAAGEERPEFLYVPVSGIEVLSQVRSSINEESDSFKGLMQSIKEQGILEPLIVCPDGASNYRLLCGERRLSAARKAEMESVPVRVVNATQEEEFIALQLTENLQREDLNPIDQAPGILANFQAKNREQKYDVDGVMNESISYQRRAEGMAGEIAATVGAIVEITGKSINSIYNGLSLLKLPEGIKKAVSEGILPVSQGYIFAANLDCPDSSKIFEEVVKKPVTNAVLSNMLTAWKKKKPDHTKPKTLVQQIKSISASKKAIVEGGKIYKQSDLERLRDTLKDFLAEIELRLQPSP